MEKKKKRYKKEHDKIKIKKRQEKLFFPFRYKSKTRLELCFSLFLQNIQNILYNYLTAEGLEFTV